MTEYAFDVKLWAAIRVMAPDLETAKCLLRDNLDAADTNFGAWPCGAPILAEASMDGEPILFQVNGEDV